MGNPKISFIVPVYRAEKTLNACVDSILSQSMPNFELLLIDDGSPDQSGKICDEMALRDSRIHVFHQKNSGVSHARNAGLQKANGEFVLFVDSDDTISPKMAEKMLTAQKNQKADLVICGILHIWKQKTTQTHYGDFFVSSLQELKEKNASLSLEYAWNAPYNKLYPRSQIQKGFDEKVGLGEDLLFNLSILPTCQKIVFLPDCLYHYDHRNENSITQSYREQKFQDALRVYHEKCNFDRKSFGETYVPTAESALLCGDVIRCIQRLVQKGGKSSAEEKQIMESWLCNSEVQEASKIMYRQSPTFLAVWFLIHFKMAGLMQTAFRLQK
ncbi:MAG: glycosyltransferase [Clostridiales bacterium]|jgi:glycosyltransferase involved in cell wall biosynthesis|nr:glycosyltransferase [Clostridiales bacterium]MCI1961389.1 glycosyltransferase [Clostridiales bacterium]MCI2022202.1 glycosyltransferase [Clostridiales bacterium]MCI2025783.1 glycosyltransferase [Clostridiales bacterium]